jgi:hypothetical protein
LRQKSNKENQFIDFRLITTKEEKPRFFLFCQQPETPSRVFFCFCRRQTSAENGNGHCRPLAGLLYVIRNSP